MAKIRGKAGQKPPVINKTEVFQWLKSLPLAPEYYPTLEEFQDPIAYIYKIEKEASKYGICKIIPPVQLPSSKTTLHNLSHSLLSHSASSGAKSSPTFTTREQQVGFCPRRHRPVSKPVWQSGKSYTLPQFEEKAKLFEKNYLKRSSKKGLSSLEIETLYWKATVDKPFSVEYANDMPGSAFVPLDAKKGVREEALTVGETEWNMRRVSRSKGSLLRYMKEDIPGVTSPMIYIAMLFSWFAWHVEDHDLHSLNYMHMGAGKTWYGVPKDAAFAFEEVIRSHGYGGEINPIVTFATLAKKTTVMSPEVILNAGIPCCRLVQNAGEFVVTFPRAYHSGFSHGFNCAEASNIATPEWLRFATKAAIRRASINCPPLVSHIQLLYDLAMSLSSRVPMSIAPEPRSSRLKQKKKCAGESLVKELFMQDVMQNTDLLYNLGKGSPIITLPRDLASISMHIKTGIRSQSKVNSGFSFGLLGPDDKTKASNGFMVDQEHGTNQLKHSIKGEFSKLGDGNNVPLFSKSGDVCTETSQTNKMYTEGEGLGQHEELPNKGMFSCVACGILCFACVAVIQPTEVAARNIMSADCSNFLGLDVASEVSNDWWTRNAGDMNTAELDSSLGRMVEKDQIKTDGSAQVYFETEMPKDNSSLSLLALTYGDSSDSDEDQVEALVDNYETCQFLMESKGLKGRSNHRMILPHVSNCSSVVNRTESSIGSSSVSILNRSISFSSNSDEDSSRLHVFCLQHAVEVEQKLRPFGGVHMLLLSHPDFPKLQTEAKLMANELGSDHHWSEITFREATIEDEGRIKSALTSEEVFHGNGDWAVKLGVNLFYSANLSRSPLYSKQMPYNSVLYGAFGHNSSAPTEPQFSEKVSNKQKKAVVAGKWCGKVWMSNQVHHMLAERDLDEKEQDNSFQALVKLHRPHPSPSLKPDEPSKSQTIDLSSVSWSCKGGRKRKRKSYIGSTSTSTDKSIKVDEPVQTPDQAPPKKKFILQYKRRYKNKEKEKQKEEEKEKEEKEQLENPQLQENYEQGSKQLNITTEDEMEGGPSTRLRRKKRKEPIEDDDDDTELVLAQLVSMSKKRRSQNVKYVVARSGLEGKTCNKRAKETPDFKTSATHRNKKIEDGEAEYICKMDGCTMTFVSKKELMLHEQNICPLKQCRKTFFSHKYLLQHQKVHMDDRPLVCPWAGCQKTFKWAWARTEHIRVHSGDRPYTCAERGCGQTFRFVSDFSRHKRKTGHSARKRSKKAKRV